MLMYKKEVIKRRYMETLFWNECALKLHKQNYMVYVQAHKTINRSGLLSKLPNFTYSAGIKFTQNKPPKKI